MGRRGRSPELFLLCSCGASPWGGVSNCPGMRNEEINSFDTQSQRDMGELGCLSHPGSGHRTGRRRMDQSCAWWRGNFPLHGKTWETNGLGVYVERERTRVLGVVVWNWVMGGVEPVNGDYARRVGQLKCLWESWALSDLGSKGLGKVGQMWLDPPIAQAAAAFPKRATMVNINKYICLKNSFIHPATLIESLFYTRHCASGTPVYKDG